MSIIYDSWAKHSNDVYAKAAAKNRELARAKKEKAAAKTADRTAAGAGLIGNYQQMMDESRQANETRYQQLLQEISEMRARSMGSLNESEASQREKLAGLRTRSMENLEGLGESERVKTARRFQNLGTAGMQDLVSRGLSGSTLTHNLRSGLARDESEANMSLSDMLRRERLGVDERLSGQELAMDARFGSERQALDERLSDRYLGVVEGRNDTGPDAGLFAGLIKTFGEAGIELPWDKLYGGGGGAGTVAGNPPGRPELHRFDNWSGAKAALPAKRQAYPRLGMQSLMGSRI